MADLKPCPFCGRIPDIEYCGEHRWFIRCKCGIAQDKLFWQKCDAVRAWNKRKKLRVKDTNVPITDTISRKAAIEAFQKELTVGKPKESYVTICCAVGYKGAKQILERLPSAEPDGWFERNKDEILKAGMEGREVEFRIGGRLFAIREKAQ